MLPLSWDVTKEAREIGAEDQGLANANKSLQPMVPQDAILTILKSSRHRPSRERELTRGDRGGKQLEATTLQNDLKPRGRHPGRLS